MGDFFFLRKIRLPSRRGRWSDEERCRLLSVRAGRCNADVPFRAASSENHGLAKRSGSMPSIPPTAHWTPVVETPTRIGAPFAQQTENIGRTPTLRPPPCQRKQRPSGPSIALPTKRRIPQRSYGRGTPKQAQVPWCRLQQRCRELAVPQVLDARHQGQLLLLPGLLQEELGECAKSSIWREDNLLNDPGRAHTRTCTAQPQVRCADSSPQYRR